MASSAFNLLSALAHVLYSGSGVGSGFFSGSSSGSLGGLGEVAASGSVKSFSLVAEVLAFPFPDSFSASAVRVSPLSASFSAFVGREPAYSVELEQPKPVAITSRMTPSHEMICPLIFLPLLITA